MLSKEHMSEELDPKTKREQYFKSLEAFIKLYSLQDNEHKAQIKKRIKELLPAIYQPGMLHDKIEFLWAADCIEKIMKACQTIEECEEFLAIIDLENKRPLFYSLLDFFCTEPERYAPLIKKLAPKAYSPKNDFEYEKTTSCLCQLVSSSYNEAHCLELINTFPLGNTQFELENTTDPLLHALVSKNFQRIIEQLATNLNFQIIDSLGWSALHVAADHPQDIGVFQLLIRHGVSSLARTIPTPGTPKKMLASDLVEEKLKLGIGNTTMNREIYNLLIETEKKEKEKMETQAARASSSVPLQPNSPLRGDNGSSGKVSRSRPSLFVPGKENDDPTLPLLSRRPTPGHSQSE